MGITPFHADARNNKKKLIIAIRNCLVRTLTLDIRIYLTAIGIIIIIIPWHYH